MKTQKNEMIVAEITVNWTPEQHPPLLLSQRFEEVIKHNMGQGYQLHSWRICAVTDHRMITETVIAVFKKRDPTTCRIKNRAPA